MVLLDISASLEARETIYDLVRKVGEQINFTFKVTEDSFKIISIESENQDASMDHSNLGGAHE